MFITTTADLPARASSGKDSNQITKAGSIAHTEMQPATAAASCKTCTNSLYRPDEAYKSSRARSRMTAVPDTSARTPCQARVRYYRSWLNSCEIPNRAASSPSIALNQCIEKNLPGCTITLACDCARVRTCTASAWDWLTLVAKQRLRPCAKLRFSQQHSRVCDRQAI